jgi:hypothetical protein
MLSAKNTTRFSLSLTAAMLAACGGGDSVDSNESSTTDQSVVADSGGSGNENTAEGGNNSSDTDNNGGTNESSDPVSTPVVGEGMPFLYQTGYTLLSYRSYAPGREGTMVQFTTDTESNTIQDDDDDEKFPELRYDEAGRVTSFGFNILRFNDAGSIVTYNSDNTIAEYAARNYNAYSYDNGVYASATFGSALDGGREPINTIVYNYAPDGTLTTSRFLDSDTGEQTNRGYDYTVNEKGLVDSLQLVNLNTLFRVFRITFAYDDNNNITRSQTFSESGDLIFTWDFQYEPSSEPTPNIVGFLMISESGFRARF